MLVARASLDEAHVCTLKTEETVLHSAGSLQGPLAPLPPCPGQSGRWGLGGVYAIFGQISSWRPFPEMDGAACLLCARQAMPRWGFGEWPFRCSWGCVAQCSERSFCPCFRVCLTGLRSSLPSAAAAHQEASSQGVPITRRQDRKHSTQSVCLERRLRPRPPCRSRCLPLSRGGCRCSFASCRRTGASRSLTNCCGFCASGGAAGICRCRR